MADANAVGDVGQGGTSGDNAEQGGMTEAQKRENVIRLAFGGDPRRFEMFCDAIREAVNPAPGVMQGHLHA